MRTTYHIIAVILATLMAAMIFGTSFLLQTLGEDYIFIAPSSCFYAIAALLLILIISVTTFYKLPQKLINKNPRKISTLLFLLFVSITILLSIWFPADINYDYLRLHRFAIDHPNSLSEEDQLLYFSRYPYQINVATIFAYIYKIFHSWRAVILVGAMSALGACFITAKVVYNITHSKSQATFALAISCLLLTTAFYTYAPYTDNYAILFPILTLYIYMTRLKQNVKLILLTPIIAIGYLMKQTTLILPLAITFIYIAENLTSRHIPIKKGILSIFIFLTLISLLPTLAYKSIGFTRDANKENRISYFLNLGQDSNTLGRYSDETFKQSLAYNTIHERDSAMLRSAFLRIKEKGIYGNISFFEKKLMIMGHSSLWRSPYRYGRMNPADFCFCNKLDILNNPIREFFISEGKYHTLYMSLVQVLWDMILLLVLFGTPFISNRNTAAVALTVIGSIFYLLLFECSPRYLYLFIPFYVIMATISLTYLKRNYRRSIEVQ